MCAYSIGPVQGAPIKKTFIQKFILSVTVIDFFTKFTASQKRI